MWILKKSKELLDNLKAQTLLEVNNIKTFGFSTLYTTIPHGKLKSKLKEIINSCFFHKNGNRRYKYIVLGYQKTYFVKDHSDVQTKYSEVDVIRMLDFLIDNIYLEFSGLIFQLTVGIPMGTNSAPPPPPLADLFFSTHMRQNLYKVS